MTPKQRQQRGRWLIAALQNDRPRRAEELIRHGADLSVRAPDGDTALYAAVAHYHHDLVAFLLEHGADPNVPGANETYPIHVAAEWGREHAATLVEALLRHGARIDVRDDEGATPIFLAGKSADAETIRTLLRHGANISDRNNEQDTALTFACCWGMTERAAMLLELGIDLQACDNCGMNALSWATWGGHADTMALLLGHGARVDTVDRSGQTPLIYAAERGSPRCVALLLEAGADPRSRDARGQSALDHAARYAGKDLLETLQAEIAGGVWGQNPDPEQLIVERFTTSGGEPAVRISAGSEGSGWSLEKCDGFDAVVALLDQSSS